MADDLTFKLENGEVRVFRGNDQVANLGTIWPNDEQVMRVIQRAVGFGKQERSRELRDLIGASKR